MPTIYRFPILYRLAMRVGYGTDYGPRHALVAPAGAAIMQASLYQFHDIADALLPRMWEAARSLLVIAEPVRNVSRRRVLEARLSAPTRMRRRVLGKRARSTGSPLTLSVTRVLASSRASATRSRAHQAGPRGTPRPSTIAS